MSDDPRRSQALWEMGIIYLSRYSDPDASYSEGLAFIRQSAIAGDLRAKALYSRLLEAFPQGELPSMREKEEAFVWLQEAASAGHQAAIMQIAAHGDDFLSTVTACQANFARTRFQALPATEIANWHKSAYVSSRQDTLMHRAAATGHGEHLAFLLGQRAVNLDAQNTNGDTPLLLACRFGQFKSATALLEQGADASVVNNIGENALHYIWCFFGHQCEQLLDKLVDAGASVDAVAEGQLLTADLDILPLLPGRPVERAAGRRRYDIVWKFFQITRELSPAPIDTVRMLFWALRLHDIPTQQLLLAHTADPSKTLPYDKISWVHEGNNRNLIGAACAGWVSTSGKGWDVPLTIWSACCLGRGYLTTSRQSLTNSVYLLSRRRSEQVPIEHLIDASLAWTFSASLHQPFAELLSLKVKKTNAAENTLPRSSIEYLEWHLQVANPAPM